MMNAVRIHEYGDYSVLKFEKIPIREPAENEVLIRIKAIGVNYIDIYNRKGLYKLPLPTTIGQEASGIIEKVGNNVTDFKPGDRVAYCGEIGSYAEFALVPKERVIMLPNNIDFNISAAILLQGMTAHYLTHDTYPLKPGDTCLIHAAAGGVGLLLIQIAKQKGAYVIGTVSTQLKANEALKAGADHVIVYSDIDFEEEVKKITRNQGVKVVYDSVGQATFVKSLNCLSQRGTMVSFGQSSGIISPFDISLLSTKGSLFLTRPNLSHYTTQREELLLRAYSIFNMILNHQLLVKIDKVLALNEAHKAHQYLESRKNIGKLLLVP